MMNLPSPAAVGLRLDFEKTRNSSVSEEKGGGGLFNRSMCVSSEFSYRGNRHVDEEISLQTCYLVGGDKEDMLMMGPPLLFQKKSCFDLMQNCDLPPPAKVFAGADKTVLTSFRPTSYSKISGGEDEFPVTRDTFEIEKLELLKALQLSQTRAREAERKATLMTQERDRLSNSVLKESLQVLAYRQWVKLLEFEVSQLQSHNQKQQEIWKYGCRQQQEIWKYGCRQQPEREDGSPEEKASNGGDIGSLRWSMALALCFGIASVGFCFGCRYILF